VAVTGVPSLTSRLASKSITTSETLDRLPPLDLSDRFNPFLTHFMRETLRSGGEVQLAHEGDMPVALLLTEPSERVASVFSRSVLVTEELLKGRSEPAFYAEVDLPRRRETYHVYCVSFGPTFPSHRFRYRVRIASSSDLAPVRDLARELWGQFNDRWFSGFARAPETCFLVEIDGVLAGMAWATGLGTHGRLHSLAVRPGYRRMGVGTDLLFARLLWLERTGAREAISEIAEQNLPSRAVAERAGMRPVGRIFLYSSS
jgi:RimJ/RimL family protein N-acetyltransferase